MRKFYTWSVVIVFIFLLYGNVCSAQNNFYITGTGTWSSSGTNWGLSSVGPYTTAWVNGNYATLQGSPTITISGFNPRTYQLTCTSTGSIGNTSSEVLYLNGTSTPVISIASAQTLTLTTPIDGGLGFTQTGGGTLILGYTSNKNYGSINVSTGNTLTFPPAATIPTAALRLNPVNLAGTLSFTAGGAGYDVRMGTLSGSGVLSNTCTAGTRGFDLFVTQNGTSSATITTGSDGLLIRGIGEFTQTFTGTTSAANGAITVAGIALNDSNYTNNVTLSGTSAFNGSAAIAVLNGGQITLDNSTNNVTTRMGTLAANSLTFNGGGCFRLIGYISGTTQNIGVSGTKAITLNAGAHRIIVQTPTGATGRAQLGFGGTSANFSLRDQTFMTVDFVATGANTNLGGAGTTDPRIDFIGLGIPYLGNGNLLGSTSGGTTIGWATVNRNSWATWNSSTGVSALAFTTATTAANLQSYTGNTVVADFEPSVAATLSGTTAPAVLRITPNGGTTLNLSGNQITANALMLNGTTNYTINGAGTFFGFGGTKYIYVVDANTTLSTDMVIAMGGNPVNKSGLGFLELIGTGAGPGSQISVTPTNRFNILQGTFRAANNQYAINGTADGTSLCFRGGVFEISGGLNGTGTSADFKRPLGLSTTSGAVNWDNSTATERGNGGFSAYGAAASVNIGGLTTPSTLIWGATYFVQYGYSLIFGSVKSDSRLTFLNPIGLDNGTVSSYNACEIYVYDNTSTLNDKTQLAGVISGSANSDLIKTGPGELELNASNTYAGNTIIQAGTLTPLISTALPSTTHIILLGGVLQLKATATITDITLNNGAILNLNGNILNVTGDFTNNGGTISGTGTIVFDGTSQQFINGQAITFPYVTINNINGVVLTNNDMVTNTLTLTSGIFSDSSFLTLGNADTIIRTGGTLKAVPTFGTSVNVIYNNYTSAITTGYELPLSTTLLNNLTSNNSNGVTLNANATSNGNFTLAAGAFNINGDSLSINNASTTSGTLSGSYSSSFTVKGTAGTISFTSTADTLKNLLLTSGASMTIAPATPLYITAGNVPGSVTVNSGATLTTNNVLTLRSDLNGTARVGVSAGTITGQTTVERYFPSHRSWRLVTAPVNNSGAPTINASWQEGYSNVNRFAPQYSSGPNSIYGTIITKSTTEVSNGSGGTTDGYDQGSTNNPSIYYLNAGSWTTPTTTNTSAITNEPGYMLFVRGNRDYIVTTQYQAPTSTTLRVKGLLNQGTQSVSGSGFTVIGNPYASSFYYDGIITRGSNTPSYYYIWDPLMTGSNSVGSFITLTQTGTHTYTAVPDPTVVSPLNKTPHTIDLNGSIESAQAVVTFFNSGTVAASGSSTIQEADKIAESDDYSFRPITRLVASPVIADNTAINVTGKFSANLYAMNSDSTTSLEDGVLDIYSNTFSDSINFLQDAPKLGNFAETVAILRDTHYLAIEKRKIISASDTIFYGLYGLGQKPYVLEFTADSLNVGLTGFVVDSFLNTKTSLNLNGITDVPFTITSDPASYAHTRFNVIFISSASGPLPVTFTNVKALGQSNGNITVQWSVTDQLNIKEYEVEKSIDGVNFTKVNTTVEKGNNGSSAIYNWIDNNVIKGNNFYRIISIGTNGATSYSQVVKVETGNNLPAIAVYPNPIINGTISLQLTDMPEGKYDIQLLDNIGQVILKQEINHLSGSSYQEIMLNPTVAKGIYHLEITGPTNYQNDLKILNN